MSHSQLHPNVQMILKNNSQKPSVVRPKPPPPPPKKPIQPPPIQKGLVKALLIGINYSPFPELQLYGCINDVSNIRSVLQNFYPNCKDVRILTDQTMIKPSKQNILDSIQWLVKDLKPGQTVYLHYSGHGTRVMDTNGDERSGADSCICPYNGSQLEIITDDEIRKVLVDKIPAGSKCFTVLDCCNSGTALDLRYTWKSTAPGKLSFDQDNSYQKTPGNVIFLSGCRDDQYAMDTVDMFGKGSGALTNALMYTWNTYRTNLKLKHLLWDVRKYLQDNNYEQIPQISTGISTSSEASLDLNQAI
jgi:hypothetical protein